ncbi:MAG: radical SAM protein [Anaerolineaceae bacterium]|nr:radical SAM protein [Anaerolineaceae bacterium]
MTKLTQLSEGANYEELEPPQVPHREWFLRAPDGKGGSTKTSGNEFCPVSHVTLPGGKRMPVLKTLLTSICERNCNYCAFRSGRDVRRYSFTPDELSDVFIQMYQKNMVQGIFLSSGVVGGGVQTQDRLIAAAEILRYRYGYQGFLHLKLMPGSEYDQVYQSMRLADRVSVNLEAPSTHHLRKLAPMKQFFEELLKPLQWVEEIRQNRSPAATWSGRWPSSATQFVAGGGTESDVELLQVSEFLYRKLKLARTYFSGFSPVIGTPLENQTPVNPWRRYRLYQASFLLRDYPFSMEDLPFEGSGFLPLNRDPKLAWAELNLLDQPIEINRAEYTDLVHIPGIGPLGARRILALRGKEGIRSLGDLKRLGVVEKRAAPFILVNGRRPAYQSSLFAV